MIRNEVKFKNCFQYFETSGILASLYNNILSYCSHSIEYKLVTKYKIDITPIVDTLFVYFYF
jgi:hypothetical protein